MSNLLNVCPAAELLDLLMPIRQYGPEELWLGGGSLRDALTGVNAKAGADVDLFFFNERETSKNYESEIEAQLVEQTNIPNLSVKNQARIGAISDGIRYDSLWQSVAAFPDVTVAVAARIVEPAKREAVIFAPYGIPSQATSIQPTSKFLATHSLAAYYSWLDRKSYCRRFPSWNIGTVGHDLARSSRHFRMMHFDQDSAYSISLT